MEQKINKVRKRAGKAIHSAVSTHAIEKAKQIRARYGPVIDYPALLQMLKDRKCIRHPVEIRFVSDGIEPGLFGKTAPVSDNPDDGYVISLHQHFENHPEVLPALILYQSVLVNYGDLATADDAELFASTALDLDREVYYAQIVALTDALWSG
ncbi:MAG: hypothetical protein KZQ76_00100 [Candidatus Thiodiazotropha sp. (ex Epidulcina cf. delphinae)]|nr:hypothetical protein [Candidatus Thiodiazotropha sp. (ex Epidulcina cf. delphinae)]